MDFIDFRNAERERDYMIGVRVGDFTKCGTGGTQHDCMKYSYLTSKSVGRIKRIIQRKQPCSERTLYCTFRMIFAHVFIQLCLFLQKVSSRRIDRETMMVAAWIAPDDSEMIISIHI